jgi:hypothetical protein
MVAAMTRFAPAFAFCLLAAPAAAAERSYAVTDFDRIQVDGPYEVVLTTGRSSSARASGTLQALDSVTVEVEGGTLRVHANRSAWGGYPGQIPGTAKIFVATRDLRSAVVRGSGSLAIDRARGLRVDLSLAGNGRLSVAAVDADNLNLGLLGAGRISLAGSAKQMRATIQGNGDLDAQGLKVDDAQLATDTSGSIAFQAIRTAKVKSLGAGEVTVTGPAACTVEATGSGPVRCGRGR